jgi:hypothetical protein
MGIAYQVETELERPQDGDGGQIQQIGSDAGHGD